MLLISPIGAVCNAVWDYGVVGAANVVTATCTGINEARVARHTGVVADNLAVPKLAERARTLATGTKLPFGEVTFAYIKDFFYKFSDGLKVILHGGADGAPKIGTAISKVLSGSFKDGGGEMLGKAIKGLGIRGGVLMLGYGGLIAGGIALGTFAYQAYKYWNRQMHDINKDLAGAGVWGFNVGAGALGAAGALMMLNPVTAVAGLSALGIGAAGVAGAWVYRKLATSQLRYHEAWPYPLSIPAKWLFEPEKY